jgi:8-oxo-dGTP diphosphatase
VDPHAGKWDLPGGFLGEGESPLAGLRRELREETGLEIEVGEFLGATHEPYGRWTVLILTWAATAAAGEPVAADDVAELAWVGPAELPPPEELAFRSHADMLARWANRP